MLVEIRPGEGGDDSVAFSLELADAFISYLRRMGEDVTTTHGRTIILAVSRKAADALERFSGTHRVQRVPKNDRKGRRHTSTVTVAVLDAAEVSAVDLRPDDLDEQVYKGTGPGGQHRNKVATAVRLRHRPSGVTVEMEHGRSQWQNRQWARDEMRQRLQALSEQQAQRHQNSARMSQISSGERPVKSWTWNDQRDEVLDHSTGARYSMRSFLAGRLSG